MTATLWEDGYGTRVEVWHGTPEVCPDGQVRVWHDVTVTDDGFSADPTVLGFRVGTADLAELGRMLQAVAEAVAP